MGRLRPTSMWCESSAQGTRRPGQNQSGKPCQPPCCSQCWSWVTLYPPRSHGQLPICFLCANKVRYTFIFVLPWVSRVAEKKKKHFQFVNPVCKHCDHCVFFWAVSVAVSEAFSFFALCLLLLFFKGLVQLNSQKTQHFLTYPRWCLAMLIVLFWGVEVLRYPPLKHATNDYFHYRWICQIFSWFIYKMFKNSKTVCSACFVQQTKKQRN